MKDAPGAVIAAVLVAVVTLIGMLILSAVAGVAVDFGISDGSERIEPTTDQPTILDENIDEDPDFFDVETTRGHAIALDGSGYVDTDPPDGWDTGGWTVCAVGQLDGGVNEQASHNLVAIDNETVRIDWRDGEWWAYYASDSVSGSVTVPASAAELTPVCALYNSTADELTLVAGGESSTTSLDTETETRPVAYRWSGTVDEKRMFDRALTSSEQDRLQTHPTAGIGVEDSARWMFEDGEGDTSAAFYHDDEATIVNGTWTAGVGNPPIDAGDDYELGVDPLEITPLSGGTVDETPILYVTWDSGVSGTMQAVLSGSASALGLIPVVLLLLIASAVLVSIRRLQERSL